jgi:hypothetical protein
MIHSWPWQACTEMVMPMSHSEDRSMFPPYNLFDYASYAEDCIKSFGVKPRPRWISTEFGGHVSLVMFGNYKAIIDKLLFLLCFSVGFFFN